MRINKFLSACELGSRRKVEQLVINGKVSVNGNVIYDLSTDIKENDIVKFNGEIVKIQERKVYIMLNKPKCYISSLKDEKDRKIVTDLIKDCDVKVFPVGRLDYNTEGLLLLTNDGEWANGIIHPSKHINKTYEVKLKYLPSSKQLNAIRKGMIIDNEKFLPAQVEVVGHDDDYYILNVTIYEGKNREIRRIFESLNLKIYSLKRLKIGRLELGNLQTGKYKYLNEKEKQLIFME